MAKSNYSNLKRSILTSMILIPLVTMIMTLGRRVMFAQFFSVQAFAVSATLLAAWIPLLIWITEPWKWYLIGVGLVKACGFRWYHAVMNIGITIFVMVLFFWSAGPLIVYVKG